MVNFIRDHKNWCRTCTPFEKELRRYSDWEGPPCMCWDGFEKVIWWGRFEKDLRRYSDWEGPPCMYWDGFEKVFLLRRTWEAWNYYRVVEMDLRFEMDLRRKCTLPFKLHNPPDNNSIDRTFSTFDTTGCKHNLTFVSWWYKSKIQCSCNSE